DGIRDFHVTGVQTCALPICPLTVGAAVQRLGLAAPITTSYLAETSPYYENGVHSGNQVSWLLAASYDFDVVKVYGQYAQIRTSRSEERRVGKGCTYSNS